MCSISESFGLVSSNASLSACACASASCLRRISQLSASPPTVPIQLSPCKRRRGNFLQLGHHRAGGTKKRRTRHNYLSIFSCSICCHSFAMSRQRGPFWTVRIMMWTALQILCLCGSSRGWNMCCTVWQQQMPGVRSKCSIHTGAAAFRTPLQVHCGVCMCNLHMHIDLPGVLVSGAVTILRLNVQSTAGRRLLWLRLPITI